MDFSGDAVRVCMQCANWARGRGSRCETGRRVLRTTSLMPSQAQGDLLKQLYFLFGDGNSELDVKEGFAQASAAIC